MINMIKYFENINNAQQTQEGSHNTCTWNLTNKHKGVDVALKQCINFRW